MKLFVGVVFVFAFVVSAHNALAQKKNINVDGNIVEISSYVRANIIPSGGASTEIAMESLRKGGSFAIVQLRTKKLFILAPAAGDTAFAMKLGAYFGTTAFVKGTLHTRGGVYVLTVEDVGKSIKK